MKINDQLFKTIIYYVKIMYYVFKSQKESL